MSDSDSEQWFELEIESAETVQELSAVCDRVMKSQTELGTREKLLTDELRQLQIDKHKLETAREKVEAKRTVIKALKDLMDKQAVDKGDFKLLAEHLQGEDSLQLAIRWVCRHQLGLCGTLQRLIATQEQLKRRLLLSPVVRRQQTDLVYQLAKDLTNVFTELQNAVEMKCTLQSRLQSLGLLSTTRNTSTMDSKPETAKEWKRLFQIKMFDQTGSISVYDQQLYAMAGEVSCEWRELAVRLGVKTDLVASIQRDVHTKREQAWIMLRHYSSMSGNESIREIVHSNMQALAFIKDTREANDSVLPSNFYDEPCFYGQDKELEKIQHHFWGSNITRNQRHSVQSFILQVIRGGAGVGKTFLAMHYALKFRAAYRTGVFCLNAESLPSLHVSLRQLAIMSESTTVSGGLFEDNHRFLNYIMEHPQALVVYDGVCDLDLLHRIIPSHTTNVHVLVTTQVTSSHPIISSAQCVINLEPLSTELVVPALLSCSSHSVPSPSEEETQSIQELIHMLPICAIPLGIVLAGKFVLNADVTFSQLVEILQAKLRKFKLMFSDLDKLLESFHVEHLKENLKMKVSSPAQLQLAGFEDINSLDVDPHDKLVLYVVKHQLSDTQLYRVVVQLAVEHVATSSLDAIELLEYACLMGSENVPGNIIAQVAFGDREHKELRFSQAVIALSSSSISRISECSGSYYFSLHAVVQSTLIERLIMSGKAHLHSKVVKLCQCLIDCMPLASSRLAEAVKTNQVTGLVVHLYCVAGHVLSNQCDDRPCQQLVTVACRTALEMGHGAISFDLCNRMLTLVESSCRETESVRNDSRLWTALVLLGRACQMCEDSSSAQTHYERALQWIEGMGDKTVQDLGGPAKSVLADEYHFVVDELARCYGSQQVSVATEGKHVSSRGRQQDDIYATAHALNSMGCKYLEKGQIQESIEAFEQSLAIRGSVHVDGDFDASQIMVNLATSLNRAGEFIRSKKLLEQATTSFRRFLPPNHRSLVTALNMYSWCCLDSGDTDRALKLSEEVLNMATSALPADHPQLAMALMDHAEVNRRAGGSLDVSIPLCKQAVQILKMHLPALATSLAVGLHNLGHYYYMKASYAEALVSLEESVKIKRSLGVSTEDSFAQTVVKLGDAHMKCGNVAMAVMQYKECVDIWKSKQPYFDDMICEIDVAIGHCATLMGNFEEAVKYYTEARELLMQTQGHFDEVYVSVLFALANCHFRLGQLDKAEETYTEMLNIARQLLPPNHKVVREAEADLHSLWQMKYGSYGSKRLCPQTLPW